MSSSQQSPTPEPHAHMGSPSEPAAATHLANPLLLLGAASVLTHPAQAAEPEPLDEDFLDYLSQLEGEDDDWTLFDSEEAKPAATPSAAAKPTPRKEPVVTTAKEPAVDTTKVPPAKTPAGG